MPRSENLLLNVSAVLPCSFANGPGPRAVVWVQGCTLGCRGCCNPHMQPHERKMLVPPEALGESVVALPGIEGLTLSGGEPFEQAAAASQLCSFVRSRGLSTVVFTGRTLEQLSASKDADIHRLLDQTDLLIDGPFVMEEAEGSPPWRGSRNQRLLFLTDRFHPDSIKSKDQPRVEAHVASDAMRLTGFPGQEDLDSLCSSAGRHGLTIAELQR